MKKYCAVVLDDNDIVQKLLIEVLRLRGNFDPRGYSDPARLLAEVFEGCLPNEFPDLVTVDLQLAGGKNKGMEFIEELVNRDVPSEIVIVSGVLTSEVTLQAAKLGVGATIAKPIDDFVAFIQRLERMAEIGRKRREYRIPGRGLQQEIDISRRHRPVFLSYSTHDARLATGLRRNLESRDISVWYAATTIRTGDVWRKQIENGIDQAQVFVALITDEYLTSPFCVGELMRFHKRLEHRDEPLPLILPVLMDVSESGRKSGVFRAIYDRYQCVDISRQFVDGLMSVLWQIENFLGQERIEVRKSSAGVGEEDNVA